jgi:hypothetical protein
MRNLIHLSISVIGLLAALAGIFSALPEQTRDTFWVQVGLLQPSPTLTQTVIPTSTTTPTVMAASANVASPAAAALQVVTLTLSPPSDPPTICNGAVINPDGGTVTSLSVARIRPTTTAALSQTPLRVGAQFEVRSAETDNTGVLWYQVDDGNRLVWVPVDYLQLSGNCP